MHKPSIIQVIRGRLTRQALVGQLMGVAMEMFLNNVASVEMVSIPMLPVAMVDAMTRLQFRREGADLGEGRVGLLLVDLGGDDPRVLDAPVGADAAVFGGCAVIHAGGVG